MVEFSKNQWLHQNGEVMTTLEDKTPQNPVELSPEQDFGLY